GNKSGGRRGMFGGGRDDVPWNVDPPVRPRYCRRGLLLGAGRDGGSGAVDSGTWQRRGALGESGTRTGADGQGEAGGRGSGRRNSQLAEKVRRRDFADTSRCVS